MLKIRKVKTASGKTAVQVVIRSNHQTKIIKHIGSAGSDPELKNLEKLANQIVLEKGGMRPFFPELFGLDEKEKGDLVSMGKVEAVGFSHLFAYEFLSGFYLLNGFADLKSQLLKDLVIIRVIEPTSKLASINLLQKYFQINYSENALYKNLGRLTTLKSKAEEIAVEYARNSLKFDFRVVFYDVTTLYFETFQDDELRKCGFSKDNKSNQPQILVALVVDKSGYPIATNIFAGNKFEGHTILPVILGLKEKYRIAKLTVVADAAMLSVNNLQELRERQLSYIVGARISNLPPNLIKKISTTLKQRPGIYFKVQTPLGFLICDYSPVRAAKDRSDRKKQVLKAQIQIGSPAKLLRRSRFVKETTKSKYCLNRELIEKDELLDGIKGYYTNLTGVSKRLIVSRYKDLWQIEKSFRIAKSDLLARPVFHRKRQNIEAHILIVFLALCVAKSIEIKTRKSIKRVKEDIWDILDMELEDSLTGRKYIKRMKTNYLKKYSKLLARLLKSKS